MSILEIAANYYQYFLRGTRTTILVALVTVFCGALLGCAIALMRLSKIKVLNWFSRLYITVIRGTPMLVQLYIVYFQLDFIKYPSGSIFGVDVEQLTYFNDMIRKLDPYHNVVSSSWYQGKFQDSVDVDIPQW